MPDGVPTFRLVPRLVPRPLWGRSGAQLLAEDSWRAIRAEVVADHDSTCVACGRHQRRWMVCDEDWHYALREPGPEGEHGIARLVGLRLLCPRCDRVVHLGHTETRHGRAGAEQAMAHGARVNGVSVQDMRLLAEVAFEAWARLSSVRRWAVTVDPTVAERFGDLTAVAGDVGR